jgi:phosphoglycerate dehydrogenase-like enzyme
MLAQGRNTMRLHRFALAFILLGTVIAAPPTFTAPPAPAANALIEELGLTESSTPISKHPKWKPERIIVMLMPKMGTAGAEIETQFKQAAGDVELVFVGADSSKLTPQALAGADAVIGMCTTQVLKSADAGLLWIHNFFVGMDYCTGASETQLRDVVFTNNKRLSGPAIAEHAIAMLLAITHNLPAYSQAQRKGKWQMELARDVTFGELKGKTMLVIGLGGIGTEIARRAHGLGMRVIATRSSSREGPEFVEHVGLSDELLKLAADADVIANALPLTPQTTGIINKAFFDAAKPGAIYLSVGRGKTTVTADLVAALQSGKLFGAGLDVTDPEPLPKDSPLWHLPNVIITPHVSAAGADSPQRTMIIAVENLRRYVAGEPLLNVVDMRKGY